MAGGARSVEVKETRQFTDWLIALRDDDARAIIAKRITRLAQGLSGDAAPVGGGVSELRVHYGPGYRVYHQWRGRELVILLCGGDKSSQKRDMRAPWSWRGRLALAVELRPFNPAFYLDTPEAVLAYVEDAILSGDAAEIADSLEVVARASGLAGVRPSDFPLSISPGADGEVQSALLALLAVLQSLGLKLAVQPIAA